MIVQNTDIVSQITHYITPDTPGDLIKVVLWTTDLLYARESDVVYLFNDVRIV